MASVDLEYNQGFKIYNANGTRFNNLVLHKATYETVVMSLGDKISGIVYYKNNKLVVNMTEYIMYKDVKYVLVNPPTVIKEGLVSDNGELKGMTKYSFTFYHPMYMLSNFPFSDVAVDNTQKKYLSQNKTFSWIGNLTDYVAKLNKNLEGTQWKVSIGTNVADAEKNKLSEVLSFDNNTIADALKTAYETWEIPYVIDQTYEGNKRFLVRFGLPNNEIYEKDKNGNFVLDDNNQKIPFVFKYGQGVGLKNNSRTPKNNKIVTRIAGYGSEDNIPYGYPQIVWTGNQDWNYTINNDSTATNSYPIYDGIVGGQKVRLIKHPFTRTHLMPPIYKETVNKKVNPNATGYNPNTEIVDYYDANDNTYPNQIKAGEQSYEIHEFEDIKPEFGSFSINSATPYDGHSDESITQNKFLSIVDDLYTETDIKAEKTQLNALRTSFVTQQQNNVKGTSGNYEYDWSFKTDGLYKKVKYTSSGANFEYVVNVGLTPATIDWDDTMDEQGNYVQSYFKVTIPALGFDLYASAAITQEMTINMRSGACIGCSFPVMVDWDDYKRNFYDKDGNFAPNGTQRNLTKYPNSTNASITLILQKETNTFGTLMPNIYQKPASGDKFVVLGISLPTSYITTAEGKLETEMKKYMRDNNVYYYEYPLKFDEHFLISNEHILSQMKPNVIVNFEYADVEQSLYIKQMSIKYNESPLPKYDITLTDDVDVVLNKIGEAIAEYRGQRQYENGGGNSETLDGNKFLRKDINDTASGTIRMLKGLQVGERFVTGLLGEGGIFRKDEDGTTYLECDRMYVRMKAYFDTVEVRRFLHSGGNRIASAAGIKCSRVEYIASNGLATQNVNNAVKFRCYFRAQDNGVSITNDFEIGDQAYCKETNANLGQHSYWRLVIGTSSNPINGEHYIDLSNYMQNGQPASMQLVDSKGVTHIHPSHLAGSDAPIAQDDIIQLGHAYDKTRQGAIVEYVSGEDAPSYQIYQGINTYSLDNKNYIGLGYSSKTGRAYMNVYGDMFVGAKPDAITGKSPTYIKYVQDDGTEQHKPKLTIKGVVEMLSPDDPEKTTTLDDFAKAITDDIEYLQQQVDGEIDTWFYDGVPTLNNYPASDWTTDNLKKEHIGDLYYDKLNGNAYRFIYDKDSETYSWLLLSDSAILEALRIANEAKDTADHKRRVFLTDAQHPHPTPPYDEGDLWVNAVWPYQGQNIGSTYNDEILKCIKPVPREEGGSDVTVFSIGDWSAANGYKTALSDFINNTYASFVTNIQTQVDRKAQTWYLSFDPSYSWAGNEKQHVGDLWYCTEDIENTDYKKNTTWIYQEGIDPNTGEPVYYWAEAAVPDEVFDMIDGKSAIYTEWGAWIDESGASSLQVRDLLIPAADIVRGNVTYKQNKVYRCTNRNTQNPVFEEIAYTDNSAFNGYINAILNGTGSSGDAATVAAAQKAIKEALGDGTLIEGGLVLTSLIGMRDKQNKVWAGINGQYQPAESGTGYKGHGIAAWYGGGMADWEVYKESHPTATINDTYAKSLFRFDGSGYLAGGNITWTKNGQVTISDLYTMISGESNFQTDVLNKATLFSNLFHTSTTGTEVGTNTRILPMAAFKYIDINHDSNYAFTNSSVLNYGEMKERFVPLDFFNALFAAFSTASPTSSTTPIDPKTWTASTVINNLKIKVGTWTEQYLSALGNNPNASGGGGISDLSAVLNELNSKNDLSTGVLVRNGLNNWSWMPYNAGTSGDYLPKTGGALTGNLQIKREHDLSQSNNGVSSTGYYGYYIMDKNNKRSAQYVNSVYPNGNNSFWMSVTYDVSGTTEKDKGFGLTVDKNGNCTWSISDAPAFRTALGINLDNLVTTNTAQKITGVKTFDSAIGVVGGLTPIAEKHVNDVSGSGRLWIKRALRPDEISQNDGTPNNGIVFEFGGGDWVGRLYMGDNGKEGLYFGGVYEGVIQEWRKLAFASQLGDYVTLTTAQTITGLKTFEYTATSGSAPLLKLNDKGTINESRLIWALRPNMTSQQWGEISVGKSATSKNLGQLAYKHVGDSSNNNFISLGIYGIGAGLCVYGNKSVYIGGGSDVAPSYTLHVNGTCYTSGDSSIGGKLLVGASSTNFRMHVMGGIVAEYDSTYKGSFRAVRGNYMGSFGVNASGYTVFATSYKDGSNATTLMSLTPYNATNKYVYFPHNVEVEGNIDVSGSLKAGRFLTSHNVDASAGTAGWLNVAIITVLSSWANQPLKFRVTQRRRNGGEITIRFTNVDSLDPKYLYVSEFFYTGDITGAVIVQSGNTFSLYIQKAEPYEYIGISLVDYGAYAQSNITVTWTDGFSSSQPSGTVASCRYYFASNVYMEYDSAKEGVHIVNGGLYTDKFVSTLGAGTSGSSGGDILLQPLSDINGKVSGTLTNGSVIMYTGSRWEYRTISSTGITSITLKTPTGFYVNNSTSANLASNGTFTIGFGGSVAANSVLAAPNNENGTPSWRKLVADDIPDLSSTYLKTNGVAESAKKLSDTADYKAWGQVFFTNGKPKGVTGSLESVTDITMSGNIYMSVDKYIYTKISGSNRGLLGTWSGYTAAWLGYYTAHDSGYDMLIYGKNIKLFYGTSATQGFVLNNSGNVGIGTTEPACKLHVNGTGCMKGGLIVGEYTQQNHMLYVAGSGLIKNNLTISNPDNTTNGAYIKIGGATLTWDGSALKCDKDFYSTGAVSALGSNTSGGGGGISDISVDASLSGTILTINVSGQSDTVDLSSISGTSGNYIPLSGGSVVTGNLNPATGYNNLDLGNSTNKWRQIWGKDFIGETISLLEDKNEINFRYTQHDNFGCKVGYRTSGNEALVFANKNSYTSFMFYTGRDLQEDTSWYWAVSEQEPWNHELPAMQIRRNSVYINSLVTGGTEPQHTLHVNGTGYFENAVVIQNGGIAIQNGTIGAIAPEDSMHQLVGRTEIYGNVGIGKASSTVKLDVNGVARATELRLSQGFYIDWNNSNANAYTIGEEGSDIYAEGDWYGRWASSSDVRLKDIDQYLDGKLEDIALAPIFSFRWKNKPNKPLELGTSAQYWKVHLSYGVTQTHSGYLALDYGATALAAAVFTARKVVDHELRIKQLEQENAILRNEIEELKAA